MKQFIIFIGIIICISCNSNYELKLLNKSEVEIFTSKIIPEYESDMFTKSLNKDLKSLMDIYDGNYSHIRSQYKEDLDWYSGSNGFVLNWMAAFSGSDSRAEDFAKRYKDTIDRLDNNYFRLIEVTDLVKTELPKYAKKFGVRRLSKDIDVILDALHSGDTAMFNLQYNPICNEEVFEVISDYLIESDDNYSQSKFLVNGEYDVEYMIRYDLGEYSSRMPYILILNQINSALNKSLDYEFTYIVQPIEKANMYEIGLSNGRALKVDFGSETVPATYELCEYTKSYEGFGLRK